MSDPKVFGIDQYAVWTHDLNGPINPLGSLASSEDESMKIVVTYADHVEALRQATALATPETVMQANYWYEQGQRDALAGAVQRVEALKWDYVHSCGELITRAKVIAAIKGDQP